MVRNQGKLQATIGEDEWLEVEQKESGITTPLSQGTITLPGPETPPGSRRCSDYSAVLDSPLPTGKLKKEESRSNKQLNKHSNLTVTGGDDTDAVDGPTPHGPDTEAEGADTADGASPKKDSPEPSPDSSRNPQLLRLLSSASLTTSATPEGPGNDAPQQPPASPEEAPEVDIHRTTEPTPDPAPIEGSGPFVTEDVPASTVLEEAISLIQGSAVTLTTPVEPEPATDITPATPAKVLQTAPDSHSTSRKIKQRSPIRGSANVTKIHGRDPNPKTRLTRRPSAKMSTPKDAKKTKLRKRFRNGENIEVINKDGKLVAATVESNYVPHKKGYYRIRLERKKDNGEPIFKKVPADRVRPVTKAEN